jgi:hypothetical protein
VDVRVQCTDASGQAGVSGRIARMLKQQARRRAVLAADSAELEPEPEPARA